MKYALKKLRLLLLILALCTGIFTLPISARSSYYLSAYSAWLYPESGGRICVAVDVQATNYMDEVGAKRIEILESQNNGKTWTVQKIYLNTITPGMYDTDTYFYYDDPVTYYGVPGYTYCAIVTVYASDSTGSDSREYTTPMVTAIN